VKEQDKIERMVNTESKRLVTKIFKFSLMVLEDLRQDHLHALHKLEKDGLSEKQLEILNYLDFHKYSLLRKRILDNGNESIRDLENLLDYFEFNLKNKETPIVYKKAKGNEEKK
jgi:hypothetical protein